MFGKRGSHQRFSHSRMPLQQQGFFQTLHQIQRSSQFFGKDISVMIKITDELFNFFIQGNGMYRLKKSLYFFEKSPFTTDFIIPPALTFWSEAVISSPSNFLVKLATNCLKS